MEKNELKILKNAEYGQAVESFEFIKKFNQVNVENVLKKLKIDKANFYNFKCKKSDYIRVKNYLLSEFADLFVIKDDENE